MNAVERTAKDRISLNGYKIVDRSEFSEQESQAGGGGIMKTVTRAQLFSARLTFYRANHRRENLAQGGSKETVRAFCKRAGISPSQYYAWYNGLSSVRITTVEKVAANLNVHPGWLAFGEERYQGLPFPEGLKERLLTI